MGRKLIKFIALQKEINKEIKNYLLLIKDSTLCAPISYALSSNGKRLRPILTKIMAKSVGKEYKVGKSALAIELFHTASLIADDLPCMENDDERRGKPSLHRKFKESTALLASYALLTEAFSQIEQSGREYFEQGYGTKEDAQNRVCTALKETARLSGPLGAALGQYFDIEQANTENLEAFEELYYLKTGTLFQGAFTLGYVFGGGDLNKLYLVEKLARHLGLAFQIRDDLEDINEPCMSFSKKFGVEVSVERCKKEIEGFFSSLNELKLDASLFEEMITFLFPKETFQTSPRVPL